MPLLLMTISLAYAVCVCIHVALQQSSVAVQQRFEARTHELEAQLQVLTHNTLTLCYLNF
jgi:hypothetical protein